MENIDWEEIHFNELETILQIDALGRSAINEVQQDSQLTPVCLACRFKREDLLTVLLHHGASANKHARSYNRLPLHYACYHRKGNHGIVRKLLEAKTEIDAQDNFGNTALHYACQKFNVPVAKLLIEHGASVSITNVDGNTPLVVACLNSRDMQIHLHTPAELVDVLLKAGSDPNVQEGFVLEMAVGSSSIDVWKVVLASVDHLRDDKRSILNTACGYGSFPVIKALLEKGANVNGPDGVGWFPLHTACYHASLPSATANIQLLLEWGADVHARTDSRAQPLHIACSALNEEHIKILLANGADVNSEGYLSTLPFMTLIGNIYKPKALKDKVRLVHLLIAAGCYCPPFHYLHKRIPRLFTQAEFHIILELLAQVSSNPQDLKSLCRISIRKSIPPNVDTNVEKLPLPPKLIRFLKFNNI